MAVIQFSADLNEARYKSCGRSARFFCAYFQRVGGKRELTPYDCRSRGFRWPCPPQRHWPLVRLPFARTRAAKWHFRCAVVGCHLPPPSPHPTCAVWWCVWRLFAPVTPEVPQIHLDSEIAWLVLALALGPVRAGMARLYSTNLTPCSFVEPPSDYAHTKGEGKS